MWKDFSFFISLKPGRSESAFWLFFTQQVEYFLKKKWYISFKSIVWCPLKVCVKNTCYRIWSHIWRFVIIKSSATLMTLVRKPSINHPPSLNLEWRKKDKSPFQLTEHWNILLNFLAPPPQQCFVRVRWTVVCLRCETSVFLENLCRTWTPAEPTLSSAHFPFANWLRPIQC